MPRKPWRRASSVRRRVWSSFHAVPYEKRGTETPAIGKVRSVMVFSNEGSAKFTVDATGYHMPSVEGTFDGRSEQRKVCSCRAERTAIRSPRRTSAESGQGRAEEGS